jgi:Domain of unknown function (DUF334)
MEYIEFIQNKDRNRVKAKEIENSISKLETIKNIAKTHRQYFSKLNIVRQQIEDYLKNDSHTSIAELDNKLKHFIQDIPTLESRVFELESITNFPTNEIENEIKNHIHFCYNGMDIDKINLAIGKSNSLLSKLNSERVRVQKEKEANQLERERVEQERLAKLERERLQKIENDRKEKERLERLERERLEQERLAELELERIERERLEREKKEKQELYIKIAKYVAIAIGIGLALWMIFAFIIPFIVQWWWAILLIGGGIAYLIFKDK